MSFELMKRFNYVDDNQFILDELSVSMYMQYLPVYTFNIYHQKSSLSFNNNVNLAGQEFIYPKLKQVTSERISRYSDLFQMLNGGRTLKSIAYEYKFKDEKYNAFVGQGILTDEIGSVLLVLTIHKDKFLDFYNEITNDEVDYSKLKLFVSKDLFSNPKYSLLWRKIEKEYYYNAISEGVDVEILSSDRIEKLIYSDGINVDFSNITEFQNHLNNEVYNNFIQFVTDSENTRLEEERLEAEREVQRLAERRKLRRLRKIERYCNSIISNYNTNLIKEHLIMFFNYQLENNSHLESGLDYIYLDEPEIGTLTIWNNETDIETIYFDQYQQIMLDQFNITIDDYISDVNDVPGFVIVDEENSNESMVETQEEPDDLPF